MLPTAVFFQPVSGDHPALTLSVVPVLIGPLQTLIAILPGLLAALFSGLLAMFKPSGIKKIVLFFWHQKLFTCCLAVLIGGYVWGSSNNWWRTQPPAPPAAPGAEWSAFRGGPARSGCVPGAEEPTTDEAVWAATPSVPNGIKPALICKWFMSSPAVVGDRVYVAGVVSYGQFEKRGGIFCFDADSGAVVWYYAPSDFRATYSSPAIAYKRGPDGQPDTREGFVVCGEGLHLENDAKVVCLNLKGELLWQYQTKHHVEASPCIADGRAYVGSGEDGYYCFDLEPTKWENKDKRIPTPVWHKGQVNDPSEKYVDSETCPIVVDGVLYVGLGKNLGQAIMGLDGATGDELWRIKTDYPVYCPPTIGQRIVLGKDGKRSIEKLMFIGMGNADVLQSAETVRDTWKERKVRLQEKGFRKKRIDQIEDSLDKAVYRTDGQVWCFNLTAMRQAAAVGPGFAGAGSQPDQAVQPEWKLTVPQSVLGIAFRPADKSEEADLTETHPVEGRIYFGCWDGNFRCVSTAGKPLATLNVGSPTPAPPAVGREYAYFTTRSGMLQCVDVYELKPLWQTYLGDNQVSAPAIARGHIYIGTHDDGLRCLGRPKPVPPVWTQGAAGGLADRAPMQPSVAFRARYPSKADPSFQVTAPLMPLPQTLTVTEMVKPKPGTLTADGKPATQPEPRQVDKLVRFLYAPITSKDGSRLVKFRPGDIGKRGADPVVWSEPFDRPITVAPAAIGEQIYVVEGGASTSQPDARGTLTMVQIDGELKREKKWKADLLHGGSGEFSTDGGSLFIWRGPNTLARIDREKGTVLWSMRVPGDRSIGAPAANAGLLVAATADVVVVDNGGQISIQLGSGRLSVLDADTGTVLWNRTTPAVPTGSPILLGSSILLPTDKGVYRLALCGGSEEWHANIGKVVQPLLIDAAKLVAVTDDGSLHVLSLTDGLPWRLKDGSTIRAGRNTPTVRRLAATTQVDKTVIPVLAGDRVIFGGLKADSDPAETDLMVLVLPDQYEPNAAAPSTQPDKSADEVKPVDEAVRVEPTTWCETGFLGPIVQPVVLVEGQVYTAIKDLGLVCFGKRK